VGIHFQLIFFQVDATPQTEADLAAELDKVAKQYGGGKGIDMTKFPEFTWTEPAVEVGDLK
jgi:F-type H+-transporting ATPase subunit 6